MHLIAARTARLMRPHKRLQVLCSFADAVCRAEHTFDGS